MTLLMHHCGFETSAKIIDMFFLSKIFLVKVSRGGCDRPGSGWADCQE
jgi:hypothetical protein